MNTKKTHNMTKKCSGNCLQEAEMNEKKDKEE
jgi:hypothetical protein